MNAPDAGRRGAQLLPAVLVLTDRRQARRPLPEVIAAAVDGGARGVVLREKDLSRQARAELAAALAPLVHRAGGLLLSAGELLPGCDGVHLAAGQPIADAGDALVVGRSCHSRGDLDHADGLAYVTVSPVYATSSKPGYGPPLGLDGLAERCAASTVPVYALGGIAEPDHVRACREAGAAGVAIMGAVMRSADPASFASNVMTGAAS